MSDKKQLYKITLDSDRTILIRPLTIGIKNQAVEATGIKAGPKASEMAFQNLLQDEILKLLLVEIDAKKISAAQREDLDALFSIDEYMQVMGVVAQMLQSSEKKKAPKVELVFTDS